MDNMRLDAIVEEIEGIDSILETLSTVPSMYSEKMDYFGRMVGGETPHNLDLFGDGVGFFIDSVQVSAPWITKTQYGDWKKMNNMERLGLIMGLWTDIKPHLLEQGEVEVYPGVFVDTMYLDGFASGIERAAEESVSERVLDAELQREVLQISKKELVDIYANSLKIPGYITIIKTPEFKPLPEHLDDRMGELAGNPEMVGYPFIVVNPKNDDYVTIDERTGVVRTSREITEKHKPTHDDLAQITQILMDMNVDIVNWHYNWPSIQLPDFHKIQSLYSEFNDEALERIPLTDFVGIIKAAYYPDTLTDGLQGFGDSLQDSS